MAIAQPQAGDKLNKTGEDHATLHRVIAADVTAPVESIAVDSTGRVTFPYGIANQLNIYNSKITYVPEDADINTYISNATDFDTLILASGFYHITLDINVTKPLLIKGQGKEHTFIICDTANVNMFNISSNNVTLSDMNIQITGDNDVGVLADGSGSASGFWNTNIFNCHIYFVIDENSSPGLPTTFPNGCTCVKYIDSVGIIGNSEIEVLGLTTGTAANVYGLQVITTKDMPFQYTLAFTQGLLLVGGDTTGTFYGVINTYSSVSSPTNAALLNFSFAQCYTYNLHSGSGNAYCATANGANNWIRAYYTYLNSAGNAHYDAYSTNSGPFYFGLVTLGSNTKSGAAIQDFAADATYTRELIAPTVTATSVSSNVVTASNHLLFGTFVYAAGWESGVRFDDNATGHSLSLSEGVLSRSIVGDINITDVLPDVGGLNSGQEYKMITFVFAGKGGAGNWILAPTTTYGYQFTTITFTTIKQSVTLMWFDNTNGWVIVGTTGNPTVA